MNKLSRRQFLHFNIQLLLWASVYGCKSSYPVLGSSQVLNSKIVEDHSQLLALWAKQGIRDAVLVNIDSHDDIRWITDDKINSLKTIYHQRDWDRFSDSDTNADKGLYNIGNWIYAGARLGIFKELYWVIPIDLFSRPNTLELLHKLLRHCRFSEADKLTFTINDRQFKGSFHGIPVTICGIEALPDIRQPLLLSIDTDFFPTFTENYQVKYLTALRATFNKLFSMKYQILDSAVCYSINGEYLLPIHRWVGDTIPSILAKPGILNETPSQQLSILQQCDSAYHSGDWETILRLAGEQRQIGQLPPSITLYVAYAYASQGNHDKAMETAVGSCKANQLYCTGLSWLAKLYETDDQQEQAERFYRAAFTINPHMENGIFDFAEFLKKNGMLREALEWYEKSETSLGYFPSRIMIAEINFTLGNSQRAINDTRFLVDRMQTDLYAKVPTLPIADSMRTIAKNCEKQGDDKIAMALKNTPVFKEMQLEFPSSKA